MKFMRKPVIIEATQWFKDGDHRDVLPSVKSPEGAVFQHNIICSDEEGGADYTRTFSLYTIDGVFEVFPGDWILTHSDDHQEVLDSFSFALMYVPV
jgi:hypothetical protein